MQLIVPWEDPFDAGQKTADPSYILHTHGVDDPDERDLDLWVFVNAVDGRVKAFQPPKSNVSGAELQTLQAPEGLLSSGETAISKSTVASL